MISFDTRLLMLEDAMCLHVFHLVLTLSQGCGHPGNNFKNKLFNNRRAIWLPTLWGLVKAMYFKHSKNLSTL